MKSIYFDLLQEAGMRENDFIVAIGDVDTKWMGHEEVVRLIRESGDKLSLKVVTPTDHDYLRSPNSSSTGSPNTSTTSTLSSGRVNLRSSSSNPFAKDRRRRATWNFFRRSQSKDTDFPVIGKDENVVFR